MTTLSPIKPKQSSIYTLLLTLKLAAALTGCSAENAMPECNRISENIGRLDAAKVVVNSIGNYTLNHEQRVVLMDMYEFQHPEFAMDVSKLNKHWLIGYNAFEQKYTVVFIQNPESQQSFEVECIVKCNRLVANCETLNLSNLRASR